MGAVLGFLHQQGEAPERWGLSGAEGVPGRCAGVYRRLERLPFPKAAWEAWLTWPASSPPQKSRARRPALGWRGHLLEPGDIPARLHVPDALVVILLREGAAVTAGVRGGLLFLSVQSRDRFIIRLGPLAGSPCCGRQRPAAAARSFLKVFHSSVEMVPGRGRPLGGSRDGGVAGLQGFK